MHMGLVYWEQYSTCTTTLCLIELDHPTHLHWEVAWWLPHLHKVKIANVFGRTGSTVTKTCIHVLGMQWKYCLYNAHACMQCVKCAYINTSPTKGPTCGAHWCVRVTPYFSAIFIASLGSLASLTASDTVSHVRGRPPVPLWLSIQLPTRCSMQEWSFPLSSISMDFITRYSTFRKVPNSCQLQSSLWSSALRISEMKRCFTSEHKAAHTTSTICLT